MKTKRILALACAVVMAFALCACSSAPPASSAAPTKIVVGASPSPHAQMLRAIAPLLLSQGIELEVREFTDYVLPNTALEQGDLDANFFQHITYLNNFNTTHSTHLVSLGNIHFEPLGLYSGKSSDLSNIPNKAKIAVPNDTTNEARALLLLQANGIITLKDGVGINATKRDIKSNPKNVEIVELAAEQVPHSLKDMDFGVINGNYALSANIPSEKLLVSEAKEGESATAYVNVLVVKAGRENDAALLKLLAALQSDAIRDYIQTNFAGRVVPMF